MPDKKVLRKAIILVLFIALVAIAAGSYISVQRFTPGLPDEDQLKKDIISDLRNFSTYEVEKVDIGGILDLSDEKIREAFVTFKGRELKSYLHLSLLTGEIVYANLDDIIEKNPVGENILSVAKNKALDFSVNNEEFFNEYRFADGGEGVGVDWPKNGYITYVWQNIKNKDHFIKATVDASNDNFEVVSFGKGSINWTSFCLPDGFEI